MLLRIILTFFLVIASAFLQGTDWNIAGIKINLVLVVLITLAFMTSDFFFYLFLVLIALLFIHFQPFLLEWELIILGFISLAIFFIKDYLPWQEVINFLATIFFATVMIYLLISPPFLFHHPGILLIELSYNLILGIILFFIFKDYEPQKRFRF